MLTKPQNRFRLNIDDYKVVSHINNGGFGIIYSVQEQKTSKMYAAKVIFSKGEENRQMINREIRILMRSKACGTSIYKAPEVINSNRYNEKADVYSYGILMYEVVTDSVPYPLFEKGKLTEFQFNLKVVSENYRPQFSVPVKKPIKKLIEECWSGNPSERPTFEEIYNKLAFNIEDEIINENDEDEEDDVDDEIDICK